MSSADPKFPPAAPEPDPDPDPDPPAAGGSPESETDAPGVPPPASALRPPAQPRRRKVTADLDRGMATIDAQLKLLPPAPGVYRMLDANGEALYVGKARHLKKRVAAYATPAKLPYRLTRMVAETEAMEFVTTHTEVEALLLESNLIKRLKPRYNIRLLDDKSFPFILVARDHPFPRAVKHRGARSIPGEYYGPFASAQAVGRTLVALQRAFLLRNCSDSVFASRTRPCLQYQIKRCAAPCVGRIDEQAYGALVDEAEAFLGGRSREVQERLAAEMHQASATLDFEQAARLRDRVRALAHVQGRQDINVEEIDDADVIAAHQEGGQTCIQVFFFRGGGNYGNRAYFPSHDRDREPGEVLGAFLGQFYDNKSPPRLILLSHEVPEQALIAEALAVKAGHAVELACPQRGPKRNLMDHALANARDALGRRVAEGSSQRRLLEGVAAAFGLEAAPARIEVYDNSHIQGRDAYGCMIVAGPDGFVKGAYRKFLIRDKDTAPGDDYAMMREVLTRRFARALKEDPDRAGDTWPDLVLIDGGQGQLTVAQQVLAELGIDDVALVSIAKGPDRDAGRERFFMAGREAFQMEPRDPVLYFLQRLRDEAHRFAIGTHRAKRTRAIAGSPLDEVPGIGARRKRALLDHFGSSKAVAQAGLADLESVKGISHAVAKKIYDHFHAGG
ncbi:MAG: excinuclease ABC subunit UvrC [Alphaproteobacteria bacterium]|nr:excinuclease ABC subunit UvrC [Alphaproteobacteria bacterium]